MNYINTLNEEIRRYINILCDGDYPDFIDKYVETEELQRLAGFDYYCGMPYTDVSLLQVKYPYSRLTHSIACACMAWHFTKDKAQTICALFHDLGTPAFSHAHDFKLGDSIKQASSEKKVIDIISRSEKIKTYLKADQIDFNDVIDLKKFPIIDKSIPSLCIDRLDGIFTTGLIWGQYLTLDDIKKIYSTIKVFKSDDYNCMILPIKRFIFDVELGLERIYALKFFKASIKYSTLLQSKEDKYSMQLLGHIIKAVEDENIVKNGEFYQLNEQVIIDRILNSKYYYLWEDFTKLSEIYKVKKPTNGEYYLQVPVKVRFCSPLIKHYDYLAIIDDISDEAKKMQQQFTEYYQNNNNIFMDSNISNKSKDLLKQYN